MRLPRPRFSVRSLMIVVAIVAGAIAGDRMWENVRPATIPYLRGRGGESGAALRNSRPENHRRTRRGRPGDVLCVNAR